MKKSIAVTIILGIFFASLVGSYLVWTDLAMKSASTVSEEVVYEVPQGVSFKALARDLYNKGIIFNPDIFFLFARIKGDTGKIKMGEYLLNKNMSPADILNILKSGKSIEKKLTVSEGLSIFEIAEIFEVAGIASKQEFLTAVTDKETIKELLGEEKETLEGYLFPETYSYSKFTGLNTMLRNMVGKFKEVYKEVSAKKSIEGLSPHQVVTLASIIEKETGAGFERPKVSSIFHNRLKKGMMLQTDPTVIYSKALANKSMEISITKADLSTPHPYNTYTNKGLPPGPIANPGKEALIAALNPETTNFLFFVSQNDGTHVFTETYKDHQKAVAKFQMDPKAREGKSWRDLKKNPKDK